MSRRDRPRGYTGPDLSKSLNELPGEHLAALPAETTGLVHRCYKLHCKAVRELEPGDLRVLISQQFGLEYLVPLALDLLAQDPFQMTDRYPGDLWNAVLRIAPGFWQSHPRLHRRIEEIIAQAGDPPKGSESRLRGTEAAHD